MAALVVLGAWAVLGLLVPTPAYAALEVRFANGGSATQAADGSLSGTARVGDWDDNIGTRFPVTMPDGTTTYGWCQDHMHYAPAPGNYPFVAKPRGDGSYDVAVDSSGAAFNARQPETSSPLQSPAQRIGGFTWSPVLMGRIKLVKTSTLPGITDQNGCYALSGARYGIWRDEACTKGMGSSYDLVTKADGTSNEVYIAPGTYWVREATAPKGYKADQKAHKVTVSAGTATTLSLSDEPLFESPSVWATKHDAEYSGAQGSGTLEGAEFTVRYYDGIYDASSLPASATRTWVLRSDASGKIIPSDSSLVRGGALYRNGKAVVLPLGTLAIQETKAPSGYWLEGQGPNSPANYAAPVHVATVNGSGSYEVAAANESVRRAGLSLQKVDAQTGTTAQGDASLGGVLFNIVNRNRQAVVVDGATYEPGAVVGDPLVTNEQGQASTPSDYLPVGTYEIREIATNDSLLQDAQAQLITLADSQTNTVVKLPASFSNRVVRGGVKIGKVSRETGEHLTQGEAVLNRAVFTITLDSNQPVIVGGSLHNPGEVVCTITTNEDGMASTNARDLPYGTYTLREDKAPVGFLLNSDWSRTFRVREEGVVVDLSDASSSVDDQVIRGGFSFNKVEEGSMERMALVPWLVTSATTGECHVLLGDQNGVVDTESTAHTAHTNANDGAYTQGTVDETLLNPNAGIWFSGRSDLQTTPNDEYAALPYDTYRIEELPCAANEGHELVSFTVRIRKHDTHIDMGTVDNAKTPEVRIGTSLSYAKEHVAPAQEEHVTLVDTVTYEGLVAGEEYVLEGTLHAQNSEEAFPLLGTANNIVTVAFKPALSSGIVEVPFELSTTNCEGVSLVAYERLLRNGREVASHRDPNDEGQTVHIPQLRTSFADEEGNKEITATDRVTLVDTVTYRNVVPNFRYEVEGTLMDKDTGKAVTDATGQEVRAHASFVPSETEGSVPVSFEVNGSLVAGKTLVAFEALTHAGVELAHHQDLDDEGQTVRVPSIHTEFSDQRGHHVVANGKTVELVDTVSYTQLTPGTTYTLTCEIMDATTGDALCDANGSKVVATTTFAPAKATGSELVSVKVPGDLVAGRTLVAFEYLAQDDRTIATHADLRDGAQTVYVPQIGTTLASTSGTHEAGGSSVTLVDTVSYRGLRPNMPYTLVGTLMNKTTGKPCENEEGKALAAQVGFVPQTSEGSVEVTFELDATKLAGHDLVAFEYLHEGESHEGRTVAEHADIESAEQTVRIPQIRTTAYNAANKDRPLSANGEAHIQDKVEYQGLTPGIAYVMQGTLRNKDTGKIVMSEDGVPITASTSFKPQESKGSVVVDFTFDARLVNGSGVVVFESCLQEGREVASHTDLNDQNQTVLVEAAKSQSSEASKQPSPSTGDTVSYLLVAGFAILGTALLVAQRTLRR